MNGQTPLTHPQTFAPVTNEIGNGFDYFTETSYLNQRIKLKTLESLSEPSLIPPRIRLFWWLRSMRRTGGRTGRGSAVQAGRGLFATVEGGGERI
jgi:hypothetical protein